MKITAGKTVLLLLFLTARRLWAFEHGGVQGGKSESGSSLTDVLAKKEGSDLVAVDKNESSREESVGHEKGESGSHGRKEDVTRFEDKVTEQKGFEKGSHNVGQSEAAQQGKNEFEEHGTGQYKKGYHRAGFTNNYHKDESGNKSSFYEDSDDEKGHKAYDNRGGHYGQSAQGSFRDGHQDNSYRGRDRAQHGLYDNGERYDDRRDHSRGYDNNRYYDDKRKHLQDVAGRYYDRNGNEIYYRREEPYGYDGYGYRGYISRPIYTHDYINLAPRYYEREDPYVNGYSKNNWYYPPYRGYHRRQVYYPQKGRYDGDYYDTRYTSRYRKTYLPYENQRY